MLKENYMEDPNKFINTFSNLGGSRGDRYGNSAADRRAGGDYGNRRRYGDDRGDEYRRGGGGHRKEYVDYDDPNAAAAKANPER